MIISASRRTDIPAFYATWFMNRVAAGYCTVSNPFNRNQVSRISLLPADVDAIVFWTRNPRPLMAALAELDRRDYRYYFQYTILDNPRSIDAKAPPVDAAIATFRELSAQLGPERVIWRYDPIVLSSTTDAGFHLARYTYIAQALAGFTTRSVISIMDVYKKAQARLRALAAQGVILPPQDARGIEDFEGLMVSLADCASGNGMELVSCAEELDLARYGVRPGQCVDGELLNRVFGLALEQKKDPGQRDACGCIPSRDIGMYDSCLFGCQYCYATSSFDRAAANHAAHDPASPSLIGWYAEERRVTVQ